MPHRASLCALILPVLLAACFAGAEEPKKSLVSGDPARLARIRKATMPKIDKPISFDTPEADAILSALEILPEDNPWNLIVSDWPLHPKSKEIVDVLIQESGSVAGKAGFEVGYCFDLLRTAAAELRLGLALSNLNGMDYAFQVRPNGTFTYTRFQDQLRAVIDAGPKCDSEDFWEPLRRAAVSCGAFPFAFRAQDLVRHRDE